MTELLLKISEQEKRITRLEKLITSMQPKQEQWVGATVITGLTGWNREQMRKARRNGSVKYKRKGDSYVYLIQSIPEHFIINTK
jgi:hypothetical protein